MTPCFIMLEKYIKETLISEEEKLSLNDISWEGNESTAGKNQEMKMCYIWDHENEHEH